MLPSFPSAALSPPSATSRAVSLRQIRGVDIIRLPFLLTGDNIKIEDTFESKLISLFTNLTLKRKTFGIDPIDHYIKIKRDMLLNRISNPAMEMTRTIEKLTLLPFSTFGVRENSHGGEYLVGVTKPIFSAGCVRIFNENSDLVDIENKFFNLGRYAVCINIDTIIRESLEQIHFIPVKRLRTKDRHFHHNLSASPIGNLLDEMPLTCWASVGPLMSNAMSLADIPTIFESALVFLERIDLNSILCWPDHAVDIPAETFALEKEISIAEALAYASGYNPNIF